MYSVKAIMSNKLPKLFIHSAIIVGWMDGWMDGCMDA
jgi:hypothetical protein